jgi:hypothetical protein
MPPRQRWHTSEYDVVEIYSTHIDTTDIAEAEMLAVVVAAERSPENRLLIAVDNEIVRFVVSKGHSRSTALNLLLRRLLDTKKDILLCRVPSEGNVADTPSRWVDEPYLVEERLRDTIEAMRRVVIA